VSQDNDLQAIKERIYEEMRIEELLTELECEHVYAEQNGELIVAQLPRNFQSTNKRAVQIKNSPTLTGYVRTKDISGDIFSVVGYVLYECLTFDDVKDYLYQIKAWVCNVLGYEEYLEEWDNFKNSETRKEKKNWNGWLKNIKSKREQREKSVSSNKHNEPLDENILSRYYNYPHAKFVEDGIIPFTQNQWEVGFDPISNRITYPVRNTSGELVGVKGRYVGDDSDIIDHIKYLYIVPCDKSIELWGLHKNLQDILEADEVIIFESAKSVMLAWQYGFKNAVSIEGSSMTPIQATMLKKLGVSQITFAFDKDVDLQEVKRRTSLIKNRLVYAVVDESGLLSNKDAPVDKGEEVWKDLYNNKRKLN
jgi:DNA primase